MKNEKIEFKDWYAIINGVVYFREEMKEADKEVFKDINYNKMVLMLNKLDYTVKKDGKYTYRLLKGSQSTEKFNNEEDAYLSCYLHAYENFKI